MGRKGVSKRKASKSKSPPVASTSSNGAVSALARPSASPASVTIGRGEAISLSKGKKKSSESQNKK